MDPAFAEFCAAGLWPGVGPALAGRLAEAGITGPDRVTPRRLAEVPGVGPRRAERLAKAWVEAAPAYAAARLLLTADLPVRLAGGVVAALGDSAAEQLRADPWRLLDAPDVRPPEADAFARRTEPAVRPGDRRRGAALAAYVLGRAARDGHTVLPLPTVHSALAGLGVPDPAGAVDAAAEDERAVLAGVADRFVTGLPRFCRAEEQVASGLARLLATAAPLWAPDAVEGVAGELDEAQRAAVCAAAAHGVSLLVGGPGTGKSRTMAAVVALANAHQRRVALAAPTGRAAKRLEELSGQPASTLHRLLGAQGVERGFARDASWPLDADVVVVDEASMLDVELAAALVAACADGTHLLLVGDPAQLPSIGPGRVLGDLVQAAVLPTTELVTLHRQAAGGAIARLATAVRAGQLPPVDSPEREVVVIGARDAADAAHRVVQLVTDSIPRALGIPAEAVQVVTPMHRGPAGTAALNAALKAVLNPGAGAVGGFDIGDRVVATANHLGQDGTGFANGEVGVITEASEGGLEVGFVTGPAVVPPRAVGDLRHGWAITAHRAQGSEWPAVVVVLPAEATGLLSRPLVYTAFTRGQRHLSVVHSAGAAVVRAVREVGARPRRTRLRELISGAVERQRRGEPP
jgi:exodeoxyribonuclease V alpha subunit